MKQATITRLNLTIWHFYLGKIICIRSCITRCYVCLTHSVLKEMLFLKYITTELIPYGQDARTQTETRMKTLLLSDSALTKDQTLLLLKLLELLLRQTAQLDLMRIELRLRFIRTSRRSADG